MKIQIFSVYDSKTEVFGQPNFLLNRGTALRAFQDAVNDPQTNLFRHSADFTLFHIGEWDDSSGEVVMFSAKVALGTALEFKKEPQPHQLTPELASQLADSQVVKQGLKKSSLDGTNEGRIQ